MKTLIPISILESAYYNLSPPKPRCSFGYPFDYICAARRPQEILLTYNAVGIFEHWDLSMQLFNARVKSPVENWDANIAKNPGEQSSAREALTQWAHSSPELHNLLSADIHIYNFSTSLFKRQTAISLEVVWD